MRTIRLLIVEDDPAYLYLIRQAFDKHQGNFLWELTVATDGEQALNLLFTEEHEAAALPDIILLDWNLPKVNGDGVLQRVKQHSKLRIIPILVFSSSDADRDIQAAYGNHANGYITKPGSPKLLEEIVEAIGRFWVGIAQLSRVLR